MTFTQVAVNGTPLSLSNVEFEVVLDHGRNDIQQQPQPSSCQITVRTTTTLPIIISDSLTVDAYSQRRFTGTVTDIQLSHDYSPTGSTARMTITAMGSLSRIGLSRVGELGFPEETLEDRVTNILDETGYLYTANVQPYMVLLPEAAGQPRSAMDYLTELCTATGATMCDLPDGNILFESYVRRGVGYNPATFAQVTDAWSAVPYIWSDVYEADSAAPIPVQLPNGGVVWEPIWSNNVQTVINEISVTYGDPQLTYSNSDTASITRHGLRGTEITTKLADATDAFDRGEHVLTCQSAPHYGLQKIQILMTQLDAPTRAKVLALIQGSRVNLTNLPTPAPAPSYLGVVEGWSEAYNTAGHFLTLSLSDPRYSYAMATWAEVNGALTWAAVNPTVQWFDVVLPQDLAA